MIDDDFEKEILQIVTERQKTDQQKELSLNQSKQKSDKSEQSFFKKEKRKKYRFKKLIELLLILLIIIITISLSFYYYLNQNYIQSISDKKELETQLMNLNQESINLNNLLDDNQKNLDEYQASFEENNSQLISLKAGDEYNLHDPLKAEVLDFLENYNESDIKLMISDFKNKGIRCAYVEVHLITGFYYELIGFYTLDYDMFYMEADTRYLVEPEVGKNYYNCVVGRPNGVFTSEDDNIAEILLIW